MRGDLFLRAIIIGRRVEKVSSFNLFSFKREIKIIYREYIIEEIRLEKKSSFIPSQFFSFSREIIFVGVKSSLTTRERSK